MADDPLASAQTDQARASIEQVRAQIDHMRAEQDRWRIEQERWRDEHDHGRRNAGRETVRLVLYTLLVAAALFAAGAGVWEAIRPSGL